LSRAASNGTKSEKQSLAAATLLRFFQKMMAAITGFLPRLNYTTKSWAISLMNWKITSA
jgi:hypothetical protein